MAYFFISNLKNDQKQEIEDWDIIYDVIQSISALTSAYFLGFIVSNVRYGFVAYAVTNSAIFLICTLALVFFHEKGKGCINFLRGSGAIISFLSLVLAFLLHYKAICIAELNAMLIFLVFQIILWIVLLRFIYIRLNE